MVTEQQNTACIKKGQPHLRLALILRLDLVNSNHMAHSSLSGILTYRIQRAFDRHHITPDFGICFQ